MAIVEHSRPDGFGGSGGAPLDPPSLTFPCWCGACCDHYEPDPDLTPAENVARHRSACPALTRG